MERFSTSMLVLLAVAGCSTPAVDTGYVYDAGSQHFADVNLTFGKPDGKADADGQSTDAKASDAKGNDAAETVDAAAPDVAHTDGKAEDAVAAEVNDVAPDASDVSAPDVAVDSGFKPDIPGCTPKPETCNGADDDCNGQTDETCDDGEPCTVNDSCTFADCAGTLKNCGDGNACTADGCVGGNCQHTPYPCNDNNPCTADACDPATGCTHPPLTDACDDGNPCTKNDNCATGGCAGTLDTCDDGNPCTTDACAGAQGCTHTNNTATCDDGNPCTSTDVCSAGVCVGTGGACDDGNVCTDDTCAGGTCGHVNNSATCSDGDGCTTGDTCASGACVAGTPTNCDDGLTCTTDACSGGACTHADTCGAGSKCDGATNACILTGCALPTNACANGNQNRQGCQNGRVIGRSTAKGSGGFKKSDYNCDSSNYFGGGGGQCFDTGYDHTYRIFLRKGEVITVSYSGYSYACFGSGSSGSRNFEIIPSNNGCGEPASGSCTNYAVCSSKASASYTAPAEGWVAVIADSGVWDDGFDYTLTVKLDPNSCQVAGCECP